MGIAGFQGGIGVRLPIWAAGGELAWFGDHCHCSLGKKTSGWTSAISSATPAVAMPDFTLEDALHARGLGCVAGVDEAGRGPLAGPVAAAAVILPAGFRDPGLDDSKKLSAKKRAALYQLLTEDPLVRWSVALASAEEIDTLNILRATHLAMRRAVEGLGVTPDHCLIDGLPVRGLRESGPEEP